MDDALSLALADFLAEHDGKVCGVCQGEKWAMSPFCRDCSIKLQRAGLMSWLAYIEKERGFNPKGWKRSTLLVYFKAWDAARDFLLDHRRTGDRVVRRRNEEEEEYVIA